MKNFETKRALNAMNIASKRVTQINKRKERKTNAFLAKAAVGLGSAAFSLSLFCAAKLF